jgi:hypothetical protein
MWKVPPCVTASELVCCLREEDKVRYQCHWYPRLGLLSIRKLENAGMLPREARASSACVFTGGRATDAARTAGRMQNEINTATGPIGTSHPYAPCILVKAYGSSPVSLPLAGRVRADLGQAATACSVGPQLYFYTLECNSLHFLLLNAPCLPLHLSLFAALVLFCVDLVDRVVTTSALNISFRWQFCG